MFLKWKFRWNCLVQKFSENTTCNSLGNSCAKGTITQIMLLDPADCEGWSMGHIKPSILSHPFRCFSPFHPSQLQSQISRNFATANDIGKEDGWTLGVTMTTTPFPKMLLGWSHRESGKLDIWRRVSCDLFTRIISDDAIFYEMDNRGCFSHGRNTAKRGLASLLGLRKAVWCQKGGSEADQSETNAPHLHRMSRVLKEWLTAFASVKKICRLWELNQWEADRQSFCLCESQFP